MPQHKIKFAKMHGLGNDFVVIDTINQQINQHDLPFEKIADRHLGIGCDQVLLIQGSNNADFSCQIINSDGSEAEQCGNGLRCVARYIVEFGLHPSSNLTIETKAGIFPVTVNSFDNICVTIPASDIVKSTINIPLENPHANITGDCISIGNPHFIVNMQETDDCVAADIGSILSSHTNFPEGVNVGFVQTVTPQHIRLRTFERGAGLTNACGSNACAAVAAGVLNGNLDSKVDVEFKYGKLKIEWHGKGQPILLTGPASMVFSGEYIVK